MYRYFLKPLSDFIASLVGLIILLPLFLVLILAIKIDSKGPIFFKQKRVGKNKKLFSIYKFRTMRYDTPKDTPTHLLENPDQYITKVGKFLRKTSLDELPQIFNILTGKMSIIGPRPALWNQDDLILEREKYGANNIRPGLTGLAQVNGRDELQIPDKAKLDGEYARRINLFLDIKIFFKTVIKVFKSDGVVEGGTGTLISDSASESENLTESDGLQQEPLTEIKNVDIQELEVEQNDTQEKSETVLSKEDNLIEQDSIIDNSANSVEQCTTEQSKTEA